MLRRSISIIIIIILCFLAREAKALNTFMTEQSLNYGSESADSFAWTEEKIYIAHGYWTDPHEWMPTNYRLLTIDLKTGNSIVLYDELQSPLHLVKDNDIIYAIFDHYIENDVGEDMFIYEVFELNDLTHPVLQITLDDRVYDTLIYQENFFLVTKNEIIICTKQGEMKLVYTTTNEIYNEIENDHLIIDNDYLYFIEGDTICRINLTSLTVESLVSILMENGSDYNHSYIVIDDILYYWDYDKEATVALDLQNKQQKILSDRFFLFSQYYMGGIIAFEISDMHTISGFEKELIYCPEGKIKYFKLDNGRFDPVANESQIIAELTFGNGTEIPYVFCFGKSVYQDTEKRDYVMDEFEIVLDDNARS